MKVDMILPRDKPRELGLNRREPGSALYGDILTTFVQHMSIFPCFRNSSQSNYRRTVVTVDMAWSTCVLAD
jgi:hypothetical protein